MSETPGFSPEAIAEAAYRNPSPYGIRATGVIRSLLAALEAERVAHAETRRERDRLRGQAKVGDDYASRYDNMLHERDKYKAEAHLLNRERDTAEAALEAKDGEVAQWKHAAEMDAASARRLADEVRAKDGELERLREAANELLSALATDPTVTGRTFNAIVALTGAVRPLNRAAALAPSTPKEGE